MEAQHGAHVAALQLLLVVSRAQEGQHHSVRAQGRLYHIGYVLLLLLVVEIGHVLPGGIGMLAQVIIRPVGDAPQLAPAEGEEEFDVRSISPAPAAASTILRTSVSSI